MDGELLLRLEGESWWADLAGTKVAVRKVNGELRSEPPGDLGRFRGALEPTTGSIHGQWVQPEVISMFGQRFATPVHLRPRGPGLWAGSLRPLEDRFRVFLVIESDGEKTRAFLRNPEVNLGRFFVIEEVSRTAERVSFRGHLPWEGGAEPRELLAGTLRNDSETLSVFLEDVGGSYDLHRLAPDAVSDFTPRPVGQVLPAIATPPQLDDGWPVAPPEDVGLDRASIRAMIEEIAGTPVDAIDAPFVEAVLVARHGELAVEEYFHGHARRRPHDVRSASKSHTATLVLAAVRAGIVSLDTEVYRTLYDGTLPPGLDPRASRMTLEHLVTMTSGLACDDWDESSPGGEDRVQNQEQQGDWHRYLLELPMAHEPGAHAAYCSVGMSLAGAVVAKRAGRPLVDVFDRLLARPLEMGEYHVNLMPNGEAYAGGGLRLTARDFLKLGQLLLGDGVWNGRPILEPGGAARLWARRDELQSPRLGVYGMGWWALDYEVDGRHFEAFYAGGNGGNYVIGIPELDLVIAFQASNYNQSIQHRSKLEWVPGYLIRAALDG